MADEEFPYQQRTLVEQLRAERVNAVAYGNIDRVAAVDKQLAELGVKLKAEAGQERKAVAEKSDEGEARKAAPAGRSPKPQQTTGAQEPR